MTDIRTPPLYVEDPRLQIALAALRVIARMTGYSPDKPGFRVVAQAALKEIASFEADVPIPAATTIEGQVSAADAPATTGGG